MSELIENHIVNKGLLKKQLFSLIAWP